LARRERSVFTARDEFVSGVQVVEFHARCCSCRGFGSLNFAQMSSGVKAVFGANQARSYADVFIVNLKKKQCRIL
jgi:hypothetical protein